MLNKSSYFLFGPRAVGKSTLIKSYLLKSQTRKIDYINLLDSKLYIRLKSDPSLLSSLVSKKYIVIDEVQRVPNLLNEVHRIIEESQGKKRFLLTGSSTRKLKSKNTNLLAGRVFIAQLFPFTWFELQSTGKFQLQKYLRFGGLPLSYLKKHSSEYLYNYVDTYLKEEIRSEALVRHLPNYVRFLQSAALNNAQLINYTKVASDAQLSPNTVRDYYQILEDTLIGFQVPPWIKSKKRKAIQTSKFYFFDTGVTNTLREIKSLDSKSDLYGLAFEQFIACELKAYLSYSNIRLPLQFWQSKSRLEVDFVIGDQVAIEVKSRTRINKKDHKGLLSIKDEKKWSRLIIISQDTIETRYNNGIECMYWEKFLTRLWKDQIITR